MIGEIGALGGSFIPNAMGISKGSTGSFAWGFISFALLGAIAFIVLRIAQRQMDQKFGLKKVVRAKVKQEEIEFEIHTHVPGLTVATAQKEVHGSNYAYPNDHLSSRQFAAS
jgi:hypothetical protein